MKVLVCIPHYFGDFEGPSGKQMGSLTTPGENRSAIVSRALRSIVAQLAEQVVFVGTTEENPAFGRKLYNDLVSTRPCTISGDVLVLTSGDKHLFETFSTGSIVKKVGSTRDPRELGYSCLSAFAGFSNSYDLFCYIEDDIELSDPLFFEKIVHLYQSHGQDKVFSPNRAEIWGHKDGAWKTYIEGNAPPVMRIDPRPEWASTINTHGRFGEWEFALAANPMSGCFVLTRDQVKFWMRQPDFQRPDPELASVMDIMEVVQIPLRGRLPIYKPSAANPAFLEVLHIPGRLSSGPTTGTMIQDAVASEIERRLPRFSGR